MKNSVYSGIISVLILLGFVTSAYAGNYQSGKSYEVTITNITKGIDFTPILGATHTRNMSLFEVGEMASDAVARIAEGGDIGPLQEQLGASAKVYATSNTSGLLTPGNSVSMEISAGGYFKSFSLIAMLLPTNDGLVALQGAALPKKLYATKTYFVHAYDGGSETNDELCASIPGPHCGGIPFSPEDEGEGYVYPHPGIHGEGDLSTMAYQWDGPVARVVITRTH